MTVHIKALPAQPHGLNSTPETHMVGRTDFYKSFSNLHTYRGRRGGETGKNMARTCPHTNKNKIKLGKSAGVTVY